MAYRPIPDLVHLPPEPPAESAAAIQARADRETQMVILRRLADIGLGIAEAVFETSAETDPIGAAAAYAKLAQSLRLTLLLQERVSKAIASAAEPALAQPKNWPADARQRRAEAKQVLVLDEIEAAADERHGRGHEAVDRLRLDAEELLYSGEYDDLPDRPVGEIIARLCRELGLDPDWCVQQVPEGETAGQLQSYGIPDAYADDPGPSTWWARNPPPPLSQYARPAAEPVATGPP